MISIDNDIEKRLRFSLDDLRKRLFRDMNGHGHWEGELSSSPLATAVAVFALAKVSRVEYEQHIRRGLDWLARNINEDGGWGDSPRSRTNLSTTLLCWSAFSVADENYKPVLHKVESWLTTRIGGLKPASIAAAILEFYGNDRTFSAPILMMCALAGRLDSEPACWKYVPQLPLELAALPHRLFKWLRLPVVSYAIPALIAIGLAKHHRNPTKSILWRSLRNNISDKTLRILKQIQPSNGGYLEATPLTAFVTMSLATSDLMDHEVVVNGVRFLQVSQRTDGSWPIDTNLATWVTTLSVNAISSGPENGAIFSIKQRQKLNNWLIKQQFSREHVFTHAAPGGWSWTDLPGGVPDADDTSGALLALHNLGIPEETTLASAISGIRWLLHLQNRDGGIPTFCKGWGKLPFDRSCPDITAHALRAFSTWRNVLPPYWQKRTDIAIKKGIRYLKKAQRQNGTWLPLWFGNQWSLNEDNPIYGTAQVVIALQHENLKGYGDVKTMREKGQQWLLSTQNQDHGWGTSPDYNSTIEETALALSALADHADQTAILNGVHWLLEHLPKNGEFLPAPIGLYFAGLWYYEKMYPLIFTLNALERILNRFFTL